MTKKINVLRDASLGKYDCTNGGISSKFDTLVLVDGMSLDAPDNAVFITETAPGYTVLQPARPCPTKLLGYMAGGNYGKVWLSAKYSDFKILPIHDRTETPEQYRALSQ